MIANFRPLANMNLQEIVTKIEEDTQAVNFFFSLLVFYFTFLLIFAYCASSVHH